MIRIDPRAKALAPERVLPFAASPAFLPDGDLLLFEYDGDHGLVRVHQLANRGWATMRTVELKRNKGAPVGRALSADGRLLAVGSRRAQLHDWPSGAPVCKLKAVKYHLERESLGFSPSGRFVAVADGGYVSPMQKKVTVHDAATGAAVAQVKTREWCFSQVSMLDDGRVLVQGLSEDFAFGEPAFEGHRVLACYDTTTGDTLWRRELHASQAASVDAQGRVWVATDVSPHLTEGVVGLGGVDGAVLHSLSLGPDWRPTAAAPVAIDGTRLAVELVSSRGSARPYVVVDVASGAQVARLTHPRDDVGQVTPAAHAATGCLAALVEGQVCIWRL
jgi:hypothetical protein